MKYLLHLAMVSWLLVGSALGQDPLKVAPEAYQLDFENEWVRVIRVHYSPHVNLPVHDHTQWGAAYVYLNESGPIIFKHIGPDSGPITRPPTKTGSFRLYRAIKEVHEVENPNDTPSDFLRVEFKTEVAGEKTLRGRYHREIYPAGENYSKVQFENEQVRITRLVCAPGKTLEVSTNTREPALLVALAAAALRSRGEKSATTQLALKMGQSRWVDTGRQERLENVGTNSAEFLRFEFKTKPSSTSPQSESH